MNKRKCRICGKTIKLGKRVLLCSRDYMEVYRKSLIELRKRHSKEFKEIFKTIEW